GGWALDESRQRLESALRSIGRTVSDIGRFLVTHVHRDHYTQAVAIRREFGSKVSLGIGEKPALEAISEAVRTGENPQLPLLRKAGAEPLVAWLEQLGSSDIPDLSHWEPPDEWLTEDSMLAVPGREIQAVPTPGHTQGHVVFTDLPNGLLFAGDHVLPHITPSIGLEMVPAAQPLGDFLDSLARVRAMPDLRLLPAHGPVADSTHARVDQLAAHHDERLAQCGAVVESGRDTAYRAAEELPWTRRRRRFADLDVFNQFLAVTETMAHLELLAARGNLRRETHDGVRRYTTAAPAPVDPARPAHPAHPARPARPAR
ncbi:MAG: MBL fold metallo-hydrolase, partial [Micromonosporaceae bacterium]|nr:MBL fold metallo-hydrolase [Micromonosporaceae bacterium]